MGAIGFAAEVGHQAAHDFAAVVGAGCAELLDGGAGGGFDFLAGHLLWEVGLDDGDFGALGVGEVGAADLLVLLDAVLALFDLALEDGLDILLGELSAALFDFGVFDGGFDEADGVAADGVAGAHGVFEVVAEALAQAGHGGIGAGVSRRRAAPWAA